MPKTKRRRKRKGTQWIQYLVAINEWDWSYSFGRDGTSIFPSRFAEYAHLELQGALLTAKAIKAQRVEVVLIPRHEYNADNREKDYRPDEEKRIGAAGHISLRDGTIQALLTLPADMLAPILSAVIAGRFKYITMSGDQMRYRQGSIDRYDLRASYDPEDWPEAQEASQAAA
jgi:hypothetical protein